MIQGYAITDGKYNWVFIVWIGIAALCDVCAEQNARVRIIHKENGGLSSGKEAGILNTLGKYTMVVDIDDWINPSTVANWVEVAPHDYADCVCQSGCT